MMRAFSASVALLVFLTLLAAVGTSHALIQYGVAYNITTNSSTTAHFNISSNQSAARDYWAFAADGRGSIVSCLKVAANGNLIPYASLSGNGNYMAFCNVSSTSTPTKAIFNDTDGGAGAIFAYFNATPLFLGTGTIKINKTETVIVIDAYTINSGSGGGITTGITINITNPNCTSILNGGGITYASGTYTVGVANGYEICKLVAGSYSFANSGSSTAGGSPSAVYIFTLKPLPPTSKFSFSSLLNYICRPAAGSSYQVAQSYAPVISANDSAAVAVSSSGSTRLALDSQMTLYTAASGTPALDAQWGVSSSGGVIIVNGQSAPFGKIYGGLEFTAPLGEETNTTYTTLHGVEYCGIGFTCTISSSASSFSANYTWLNASTAASYWERQLSTLSNGNLETVPTTNAFLSGLSPSYASLWTSIFRIPNDNDSVLSSQHIITTLDFAVPLSQLPANLSTLQLHDVQLWVYSYANTSRLRWLAANGVPLIKDTLQKINISNATTITSTATVGGQQYIDLLLNTTLLGSFNTSSLTTGWTYGAMSLLPLNVSFVLTAANSSFTGTITGKTFSSGQQLIFNVSSGSPNITNGKTIYTLATATYHAATNTFAVVPPAYNWFYLATLPQLTDFQVFLDGQQRTSSSVIEYAGENYTGLGSIPILLPSDSKVALTVFSQNITTGAWTSLLTDTYLTPSFSVCAKSNNYTISCTSAACSITTPSNIPPPLPPSAVIVSTALGDTVGGINVGPWSFIFTTQFFFLAFLMGLTAAIGIYVPSKAVNAVMMIVVGTLLLVGVMTAMISTLFIVLLAVAEAYLAFSTVRKVLD